MHNRFLLLKRASDLTAMEQMLVETWKKHLPLLGQAYQAKEAFFAVYETTDRREAECRYRAWRGTLWVSTHTEIRMANVSSVADIYDRLPSPTSRGDGSW